MDRFPKHFMFQLNKDEAANLRFQNGISSWGGRRTLPYAFTEHGVVMLSAVLRSARAVRVSITVVQGLRPSARNDCREQGPCVPRREAGARPAPNRLHPGGAGGRD